MHRSLVREYLTVIAICLISNSCSNESNSNRYSAKNHEEIDSVIKLYHTPDSLLMFATKCKHEGDQMGEVVALSKAGKAYRDNSDFTNAIKIHEKGLSKAEKLNDTIDIVRLLNELGTDYRRLSILDAASSYHYRALNYAMRYSEKDSYIAKKNRVTSLNGLGNVYMTMKDYTLADSVLRQALNGEKELDSPLGQAINYANIGSIFEGKGMADSAWAYYNKSMEMNKEAKSDLGVALCHTHFGQLYEHKRLYDKAIKEYQAAFNLSKSTNDEWHWLEPCISLARIYIVTGDMTRARQYLAMADKTAKEIKSLEHLSDIYNLYYQLYIKGGDCQKALDCYILSTQYNDSVMNLKKVNDIQNMRMNMYSKRQKEEIATAHENYLLEKASKDIAYIILIVGLILAAVIFAFMAYALRIRTRAQKYTRQLQMGREHFFTNITHEFRTPLTVILGLGKELTDATAEDTEKIHTSAKMIVRQGNSLLQLVNQLLDISKVKSSIGEPDWRTSDITGYMKMVVEGYQDLAKQKHITMVYTPNGGFMEMDFVPDYINKIMRNLISNAVKYTPAGGKISITTEQMDKSLKLVVSDNGIGIDRKFLPHIFEAFFQADNDSMNIGTGVGLSLVKQIVTAMNGNIEAESTPGKGTVFTVILPIKHGKSKWEGLDDKVSASHEEMDDEEETAWLEPLEDAQADKPRLLIVEDNHDVAYYICTQLDKKFNVYFASEGQEGLDKALEIMPDLIITDLMMPGMGGCEMCGKVRSSEILNHIPIIVITAKTTEEDRLKLLSAGADAYLYKPFNSEELNVRIDKLLEQRQMLRAKYSKALSEGKDEEVQMSQHERDFINKFTGIVLSLMKKGNVDVEATAAEMCMSSAQMRRKLCQTTGEKPATLILKIRMNQAKKMMAAHPEYSINQIASMCGFEDNSHFSRAFKTVFGISPSQHRKGMI